MGTSRAAFLYYWPAKPRERNNDHAAEAVLASHSSTDRRRVGRVRQERPGEPVSRLDRTEPDPGPDRVDRRDQGRAGAGDPAGQGRPRKEGVSTGPQPPG